jgi:cytochrome c biogenesis protein CcmG, thiol:disulfide interchange protein DsbE
MITVYTPVKFLWRNLLPMKEKSIYQRTLALVVIGMGLIAVGVAAMMLLTLRQSQAEGIFTSSVVPGEADYPAPDLTLEDLEGKAHSLSDYLGQVVLVNMWASWCPPCVAELPTLNKFHDNYAANGFVVIGINDGEEVQVVKDYVAETELIFPIWTDPTYRSESAFNTMNLPSSFLIDRNGQVRLQWVGAISREMLEKYVLPIIKE